MDVPEEDRLTYWRHYSEYLPHDYSEYLPIGFWGDDARFNRAGDKIILCTFNSILRTPSRASPVLRKIVAISVEYLYMMYL